jgi:hypothetical protein
MFFEYLWTLLSDFFGTLKTHGRAGRHENKVKRIFYFGLRILWLILAQLLEIESLKNSKIYSPYCPG